MKGFSYFTHDTTKEIAFKYSPKNLENIQNLNTGSRVHLGEACSTWQPREWQPGASAPVPTEDQAESINTHFRAGVKLEPPRQGRQYLLTVDGT